MINDVIWPQITKQLRKGKNCWVICHTCCNQPRCLPWETSSSAGTLWQPARSTWHCPHWYCRCSLASSSSRLGPWGWTPRSPGQSGNHTHLVSVRLHADGWVMGVHNLHFVSFLMLNVCQKSGPSCPFKLRGAVSLPLSGAPLIFRVHDDSFLICPLNVVVVPR